MKLVRCGNCGYYFNLDNVNFNEYYRGDGVVCPKCQLKTKAGDGAKMFVHCSKCENSFGLSPTENREEYDKQIKSPICPVCRAKGII